MSTTLAIVERSHRGTVEQQYAHVLWLVHGLHRQSPMTVLLRGAAAVYALDAEPCGPVVLGDLAWGEFPDYAQALDRLHTDGAEVLVSATSLDRLGLAGLPTRPGITAVSDGDVVRVAAACDRIWYL